MRAEATLPTLLQIYIDNINVCISSYTQCIDRFTTRLNISIERDE